MVTELMSRRYQTSKPFIQINQPAENTGKPGKENSNVELEKCLFHFKASCRNLCTE